MNKLIKYFFPYYKLKNQSLLSWYKKMGLYHELIIVSILYLWIIIQFMYPIFFNNEYKYKNIYIHSYMNIPNEKKLYNNISVALNHLSNQGIAYDPKKKINVYIGNNLLYYLSMYPGLQFVYYSSLARTAYGETFMRNFNPQTIQIKDKKDLIPFKEVLTHELVHIWQSQHYGLLRSSFWIKTWVAEGYAYYATGQQDVHLKTKQDIKEFLNKSFNIYHNIRGNMSYRLWGLMVKHAIEKMHKSVDDLHLRKVDYDEVLDSLLQEYNITKEEK